MSNDKVRAEFEAWYSEHFRVETGRYISPKDVKAMREGDLYGERGYLNGCWIGWQASRAALVVELPELSECIDIAYFRAGVMDAIEAAGVRAKP